ncbi:SET domain-containing protein SmydA-8, isoform B [Amphibalanus amphitrite]|uniref:SET domain-containing protein SmydA-8, isoform B n=1 Tax=Amphibalanus amphitrite TaxID=1232801 RepID=A0A6A4WBH9_AMPAM|nr:SET domain-containing protein SmydA-8, isoform B [Amphibalanus amphitrite]
MPAVTSEASSCPVCGVASSLACAACRQVHYCSRPHQKEHWKMHKTSCRPWTVKQTDELGRYMVATRAIQPGEVILREAPLVVGPKQATGPVCLGCHRPLTFDLDRGQLTPPAISCPGCRWSLCRPDCDRPADLRPGASGAAPAYGCVTPVRCLLLRDHPEAWSSLTSLEHHLDRRRQTALYRLNAAQLAGYLTAALPADCDVTENLVLEMCGVLDTNSFEVRTAESKVRAIYASASLQNHDCRPNTRHVFDSDYVITVRATVPIAAGDVISTSYTQPLWNTAARQQHLQFSKCFTCHCERCQDPTELGTRLGSLTCTSCSGALLSTEPAAAAAAWRCDRCGRREAAPQVVARRAQLTKTVQSAERTVPGLEAAMESLDPRCSQRAEVAYALVQLYGTADGYTWKELSADQLRRKQQLCEQLLQLASCLTPGQSRFRGVLLLELCRTQRHLLASRGSSNADEWDKVEGLLKEASTILQHEPGWTEELLGEEKLLKTVHESCSQKNQPEKNQNKKKSKAKRKK